MAGSKKFDLCRRSQVQILYTCWVYKIDLVVKSPHSPFNFQNRCTHKNFKFQNDGKSVERLIGILRILLIHSAFFNNALVLFIVLDFFCVADTDKQDFFKTFQFVRIILILDLLNSCFGCIIPFKFDNHWRICSCINIVFGNKNYVCKSFSCRQFLNNLILFFGIIVSYKYYKSQRLLIAVIDGA